MASGIDEHAPRAPAGGQGDPSGRADTLQFVGRVALVGLVLLVGIVLWRLVDVLLLLFGAILLAVALRGLAHRLRQVTGGPIGVSLALVVLLLAAILAAVFWLFGSQIGNQYDEIVVKAPIAIGQIIGHARVHPVGRYLVQGLEGVGVATASGSIAAALAGMIAGTLQGLAYGAFVIFGGIYLAASPDRYRAGLLRLVPSPARTGCARFLDRSRAMLERWLLGQLVVMITIGLLAGAGLRVLGIDAAIALGLTGGLLCFVPYVGAILAAVPAVLMAFTQSPADALYVVLLFVGVHFVEGNFVTPFVEDQAVSLPPLISVFSTLVFTILFGPFAVMIAVPLTIVVMEAIEIFHVEAIIGEAG